MKHRRGGCKLTYDELSELLQFNDKENNIYMPNEIFNDLKQYINDTSSHIAFGYTYIYLTTWLYRYAKYANVNVTLDQKLIKKILGYNSNYKKLDYLIKKNGTLEQMNYLQTTTDYPVAWNYKDGEYDEYGLRGLYFDMYSEYKSKDTYTCFMKGKNFKVKYPVKAFNREDETEGTFYTIENTHLVPFEVFMYSMSNTEIGVIGFYIWSYFKCKCQLFGGYDVSQEKLSSEINIKRTTLNKYLDGLKKYNMIKCIINQEFVVGLSGEGLPNTYFVNDTSQFTNKPVQYNKRNVISDKLYQERKGVVENVELDMDGLFE